MSDALIVVDMIHDFVDGKFGSENAKKIVPRIKDLIEKARRKGVLIVYTRDSHKPGDPELKIWGEHAMEGSKGSEVVEDLAPTQGDFVVSKTTYDSFFNTELERILKDCGIKNVYIVGVATDICVLHTAFGAFARGFNVFIVKDCVASINEEGHEWALKYMQTIYGAKIVESEELF